MTPVKKSLSVVFENLGEHAGRANLTLHPSFIAELENYSLHKGVSDLPAKDFEVVIEQIGVKAMDKAVTAEGVVGGDAVRVVIVDLCDNPFSDCSWAAMRVLESAGREVAARDLESKILQRYGLNL